MTADDRGGALTRARAGALAVGVALTLVTVATPFRSAYLVPGLHVVIDTSAGLVALLAGYLIYGRGRTRDDPSAWVLALAFVTAGLANLGLSAVPLAVGSTDELFVAWASAFSRLVVAAMICGAAFVPARSRPTPGGAALLAWAAGVTAVVAGAIAVVGARLPDVVDPLLSPLDSDRPFIVGHPLTMAIQSVDLVLYAVATVRFAAIGRRRGDELLGWLSVFALLSAFGRLNYLLFPSLYTGWIYTGDVLRLGAFVLLLEGAVREIQGYWEGLARSAAAEERRRVARDVHDGLAQELSFVATQARMLSTDDVVARRIASAAERALDESRLAIDSLTARGRPDPHRLLERTAEDVGARFGVAVTTEIDRTVPLDADRGLELTRVVSEAITNACRHGGATSIHVVFSTEDGTAVLRVTDDGCGFDVEVADHDGFGLVSMAERAEAVGASFEPSSAPTGTTITVRFR